MKKAPQYIRNHKNFDQDDYNYLTAKGWTNQQIQDRWNVESEPCRWGHWVAQAKLAAVTSN